MVTFLKNVYWEFNIMTGIPRIAICNTNTGDNHYMKSHTKHTIEIMWSHHINNMVCDHIISMRKCALQVTNTMTLVWICFTLLYSFPIFWKKKLAFCLTILMWEDQTTCDGVLLHVYISHIELTKKNQLVALDPIAGFPVSCTNWL